MPTPCDVSSELLDDYWFPTERVILLLHAEVIQPGELNSLRDMTMLGSAVARPTRRTYKRALDAALAYLYDQITSLPTVTDG
ncbi:MAG: hypothetical protein ACR2PI_13810 [Hyphomicrobiaceae bacterium]